MAIHYKPTRPQSGGRGQPPKEPSAYDLRVDPDGIDLTKVKNPNRVRKTEPPDMPLTKRRRGKPRRGVQVAKVSTVRIDPISERVLIREFGSVGNALFYLAEGIAEFRAQFDLPQHAEQTKTKAEEPKDSVITLREMDTLIEALIWRLDYAVDRAEARPFEYLLAKLRRWKRKKPKQ